MTGKVVSFIELDTIYSEATMEPEIVSRWLSPDPEFKSNESPYAAMSNNPLFLLDPDGQDTLIMHTTEVKRTGKAVLYKVTFSMIEDGKERPVHAIMNDEVYTVYLIHNQDFDYGYNTLSEPYYKLNWQAMNNLDSPEEITINVYKEVFIHFGTWQGGVIGCRVATNCPVIGRDGSIYALEQYKKANGDIDWEGYIAAMENSKQTLKAVRTLYEENEPELTGDKFIMKTNSSAPVSDEGSSKLENGDGVEVTPLAPIKTIPR